jgi:hypothetical protein
MLASGDVVPARIDKDEHRSALLSVGSDFRLRFLCRAPRVADSGAECSGKHEVGPALELSRVTPSDSSFDRLLAERKIPIPILDSAVNLATMSIDNVLTIEILEKLHLREDSRRQHSCEFKRRLRTSKLMLLDCFLAA